MAFLLHRIAALNGVQVPFEKSKAIIMTLDGGITDGAEVLLLTFKASNPKVHWLAQGFGGIPYPWFRSNSQKIPLLAELCKAIQANKGKRSRECKYRDAVVQVVLRGKTLFAKNSFKAATLAFSPLPDSDGYDLSTEDMGLFRWFLEQLYKDIYIYWGASLRLAEPLGWQPSMMPAGTELLSIGDHEMPVEPAPKKLKNEIKCTGIEKINQEIQSGLKLLSEHSSCRSTWWLNTRGVFVIKKASETEKKFPVFSFHKKLKRALEKDEGQEDSTIALEALCQDISDAVQRCMSFLDKSNVGSVEQEKENGEGQEDSDEESSRGSENSEEEPLEPADTDTRERSQGGSAAAAGAQELDS